MFRNTSYGNERDPKHTGTAPEAYLNNVLPTTANGSTYNFSHNIFVATEATSGNNSKSPVYGAGAYTDNNNTNLVSISSNYVWQSNPGTMKAVGNPNTDVYVDGVHNTTSFPFGTNTYGNPGFANPTSLPTTAPSCSGYADTTDCMNGRYKVAADLTPSGGAVGYGYKAPGACTADPYFPTWLKGAVYLHWTGSSVTENSGLITKPCNM